MSKIGEAGAEGLTIGAVAARTGVNETVLRAWERRFGFPRPLRLEGGHRRYGEDEVERIRRVVAERDRGRSLAAAIGTVVDSGATVRPSIFAGLREARPDLPVHRLSRRAMLAISHAIEDEVIAHADRPVLVAAFQRASVYRRAQSRWDDLSRTAAHAVVFADFARSRRPSRGGRGADEVALPATSPLHREWAVICDAPAWSACLAGWERLPLERSSGRRREARPFEAIWSVEPDVVRHATRLGLALAAEHAPRLPGADPHELPDPAVVDVTPWARHVTTLTNRIVAYLEPS